MLRKTQPPDIRARHTERDGYLIRLINIQEPVRAKQCLTQTGNGPCDGGRLRFLIVRLSRELRFLLGDEGNSRVLVFRKP